MKTAEMQGGATIAGVDACRRGWVVVLVEEDLSTCGHADVLPDFGKVLALARNCAAVAVDIPIGLSEDLPRGGREVDREARNLLRGRVSTVFNAPPRPVLGAQTFEEAVRIAKQHSSDGIGLSRQTFGILKRIAEVDTLMTNELQDRVFEAHPELSFRAMNGEMPLARSKRSAQGVVSRIRLLESAGFGDVLECAAELAGTSASLDDVMDATAVAWTARRYLRGEARRIPDDPPLDRRGLRMEMWW